MAGIVLIASGLVVAHNLHRSDEPLAGRIDGGLFFKSSAGIERYRFDPRGQAYLVSLIADDSTEPAFVTRARAWMPAFATQHLPGSVRIARRNLATQLLVSTPLQDAEVIQRVAALHTNTSAHVRQRAGLIMAGQATARPDPRWIAPMTLLLRDADPSIRATMADAFGELGDASSAALPALAELRHDQVSVVREAADRSVAKLAGRDR
jgi:hypothetical protein